MQRGSDCEDARAAHRAAQRLRVVTSLALVLDAACAAQCVQCSDRTACVRRAVQRCGLRAPTEYALRGEGDERGARGPHAQRTQARTVGCAARCDTLPMAARDLS